ncbi:GIDE domain-containing protein [Methylophaga sp.]|uniref:GIDE domain-containing protein n=1 Tax=Methylophaga sp. TaxID=2024840 RepID=UPI003F6A0FFE
MFALISVYAFWQMVSWYQHARLIQNIPTARIRSAPQGYIELIGTAKMMEGPAIVSPLSGTRCTWYYYKIEEKVRDYDRKGRARSRWRLVKEHTSDEVFLLEDETGECAIDPDDARVITRDTRVWHKRDIIPPRRYTERTILEGEPLYAMGLFKSVASVEDQTIRQQVSLKLREWKNDPNLMLDRYDADQDGEISVNEWQQARVDASNVVKRAIGQRAKMKQLSILRQSPHKTQPYIISTVSEDKLIARYHYRALAAMLGFLTLGTFLVWAMNQRLVA